MNGAMIAFTPHTTSGATVTLNVDSLGAKPLRFSPGAANELPAGTLVQGTPYVATYYNATAGVDPARALRQPLQHSARRHARVHRHDRAQQQLRAAVRAGDLARDLCGLFRDGRHHLRRRHGSTTFNVIDKRGRVSAGKDDMGGSAAIA